jgi:SAM-dependent methyltransferase
VNWSAGRYEDIAAMLAPAAAEVVAAAAPRAGEYVLDLGCGTGNAALLIAATRARVIGVDPAERLLEVARRRAAAAGADVAFAAGEAAAVPLADGEADGVVSVFGVIFAPDAGAAIAEMGRVVASSGRVVLSAWRPEGAIAQVARVRSEAVGRTGGPWPFAWHDPACSPRPSALTASRSRCPSTRWRSAIPARPTGSTPRSGDTRCG